MWRVSWSITPLMWYVMYAINYHIIKIYGINEAGGKSIDILQIHRDICLFPNFMEIFDEF
jgi:hypothetical protein